MFEYAPELEILQMYISNAYEYTRTQSLVWNRPNINHLYFKPLNIATLNGIISTLLSMPLLTFEMLLMVIIHCSSAQKRYVTGCLVSNGETSSGGGEAPCMV